MKDLVDNLKPLENVDGISYWFPEEAGNGDKGTVIPSWQNRGFWDENKSTSGHAINKTGNVSGTKTAEDVCAPYYMRHFYNDPAEGIANPAAEYTQPRKILQEGRVLILRPDGSRVALDGSLQ